MRSYRTTLLGSAAAFFLLLACNKSVKDTTQPPEAELQATTTIAIQGADDETLMSADQNMVDLNIPLYLNDSRNPATTTTSDCPGRTITPESGFPRTIVMDFGNGCTKDGITRSGQIVVMISDYRNKPGATVVTTFNKYTINGVKKEGKITWTNTSTDGVRSWESKIEDVKMTRAAGKYTIQNAVKRNRQIAGAATADGKDDAFATTGRGVIKTSDGASRSQAITIPLEKYNRCRWISKGAIKTEGRYRSALMDYGDGTCDNKATLTVDGQEPKEITLR